MSGANARKVAPIPLSNGSLPPPTTATTVTTITVAPNKAATAAAAAPPVVALPPEKLTPALIDRFILKFTQHPLLEAEFQQSYASKYFDSSRQAYFTALWLSLCLAVNDILWPDHPSGSNLIREHLDITIPLRAAVFVVSMIVYFVFRQSQYIQEAFGFCVCLIGCQQIVGGVIENDALAPTYSVIILLMASMTASYFRLRYLVCLAITWSLFIAWVILTGVLRPYQGNHQYEIAVIIIFIGDCIFSAQAYQREYYIRVGFLRGKSLVREEQKSQQILAEMLPQSVITKLRAGVDFIYEKHRRTSILFSHICDFDNHTATMSARDVVALLNNLFSGFDLITDEYGVYKVETIGDVYLVSAGCPTPRADHATVLCYLALDMMRSMSQFQMPNHDAINLRVGVHSGEVIAGVVGAKYPRYRLMGDTMNTASRMSTTCGDGDIQISEKAKNELGTQGHHIVYHERGQIQVKGKGLMTTFLVTGVVDEAHQESCKHGKIQRQGNGMVPDAAARIEAEVLKGGQKDGAAAAAGDNDEAKTSRLPKGGSKATDHARNESRDIGKDDMKLDEKVSIITHGTGNPPANSTRVSPTSEGGSAAVSPLPGGSTTTQRGTNGMNSGNGHDGSDTARITHTESDAKDTKDAPLVTGAEAMAAITMSGANGPMSPGGSDEKAQDEAYQAYLAAQIASTAETLKKTIPQEVHKARKISVLEKLGVGSATAGGPSGPRGKPSMTGVSSGRGGPNGWNQGGLNGVDEEDDDIAANGATGTKQLSTILRLLDKTDDKSMERKGSFGTNAATPGTGKRSGISPMWLAGQQSQHIDDDDNTNNGISARSARQAPTASSRRMVDKPALKRTITAGEMHNGQEKIFEFSPVDKMMLRTSSWKVVQMLRSVCQSLAFPEAKLEKGFRIDHYTKFRHGNRLWTMLLTLAILLLGIYDTIHFSGNSQLTLSWILRSIGVMAGLILFGMTYTPMYHKYMQTLSVWLLSVVGIMMVHISIELKYYDQAYGVGCVLLFSCLVCQFLGLLFKSALGSSCLILVYYIVASWIRWGSFPLICIFLFIANTFYTRSAHSSEFYLRRDFLRLLKQQSEERRARQFLTNMLPGNVVEEIRNNLPLIAHEREEASVLFTDIVSFTTLASRIAPEHVVAILNVVFSTFDSLTTKFNVYKVETIGDAYLACSGVVDQHPKHTHDLVDCALEFQLATRGFETPDHQRIVVRIGIHTGFVIAGVVGKKMPRYHLFGETVTTAEEMENKGLPGCVVVSGATYDHLDFQFDCERLTDLRIARHTHQKPSKPSKPSFPIPSTTSAASVGASPKLGGHDTRAAVTLAAMGSSPKHSTQASVSSPIPANNNNNSPVTPGSRQAALRGRFGVPKNDDGFETMARYRVRGRHGNNAPQPFRTPVRIRSAAPTPAAVAAASAAIAATITATTTSSVAATTSTSAGVTSTTTGASSSSTIIATTSSTAVMPTPNGMPPRPNSGAATNNHGLMVSAASSHNLPTGQSNGATNVSAPPHTPVSVGGVHLTPAAQFNPTSSTSHTSSTPLPSSAANIVMVPNLTVHTAPLSPRQGITPMAIVTSMGPSPAATLGQPSPANVIHHMPANSAPLTPPQAAAATTTTATAIPSSSSTTITAVHHAPIASAGGVTLTTLPSLSNGGRDMSPNGMHGSSGSPVGWKGASLDSPLLGQHHISSSGGLGSARGRNALPSLSTTLMHASTSSIHGHGILHHSGSHNNSFNGSAGAPGNTAAATGNGITLTTNGHTATTTATLGNGTTVSTNDKSHLDTPAVHHLPGQPSATSS